jgi:hypothetical protein
MPVAQPAWNSRLGRSSESYGDLLYVVSASSGKVEYMTYPQGRRLGALSNVGFPLGVCADTDGDVWIPALRSRSAVRLYEFAHGGTKPIATIPVPARNQGTCAVDPATGNLALLSDAGAILVWTGARPGEPEVYSVPFTPVAGAYDDGGNLFFDGLQSRGELALAELPRGASAIVNITLDKNATTPGGVQWDGKCFALQTVNERRQHVIYRVKTSGSNGRVIQTVKLRQIPARAWFWIGDRTIVSTENRNARRIGIWPYPYGGTPVKSFPGFKDPTGLTISVVAT